MKALTSLNRKLLWAVLISSSIITTFITLASLYTEYNGEVRQQNRDLEYLENSFLPSLQLSIWTLDRPQTLSQIKGILSSHNVFRVRIQDKNRVLYDEAKPEAGKRGNFEKKYRLVHHDARGSVDLGELTLFATKDVIYDRLLSSVLRTFFAQSLKTLVIFFMLLAIFQRMVTRHIERIVKYVQNVDIGGDRRPAPLVLTGKRRRSPDEMDLLVDSLNYHIQRMKSYQEHVIRLKNEAQQANRTKSLFLGSVSHELRTPLNTILGMGDLLKGVALPEEYRAYVEAQGRAGNHLRRMIDDLLDLTKIEAGQLSIENTDFDLIATLQATVAMIQIMGKEKNNEIQLELSDNLPKYFRSDANRLTQVLLNLLGNANKFTENGKIQLKASVVDRRLQLEVIDNGIGIAEEDQEKIFEPFKQVDQSYSKKYKGAGIGLSLSRLISRALGGDIRVESRLGEGSRFIFTLPLTVGTTPTVKKVSARPPEEGARKQKILFADDDADNQVLLSLYVKDSGHDVHFADDGLDALEKIKASQFDLVFMDIQMPKMDGYEAVRAVREFESQNGRTRVPIVALTAFTSKEDLKKAIDVGCDDFASKPVAKDEIFRLIDKYSNTGDHYAESPDTLPDDRLA